MGNRTPVFAVRGRRPGPLDDGSVASAGQGRFYIDATAGKQGERKAVSARGRGGRGRGAIGFQKDVDRGVDRGVDLARRHANRRRRKAAACARRTDKGRGTAAPRVAYRRFRASPIRRTRRAAPRVFACRRAVPPRKMRDRGEETSPSRRSPRARGRSFQAGSSPRSGDAPRRRAGRADRCDRRERLHSRSACWLRSSRMSASNNCSLESK